MTGAFENVQLWAGIDLKKLAEKLPAGIFNQLKSDYNNPKLFFGTPKGLLDTLHMPFKRAMELHLELKTSDWRHTDYDYTSCIEEFKSCPKHVYRKMIRSLAWQWQGDTIASENISTVLTPICSAVEAKVGYSRIADNEYVHALTYSEIVRGSFEDPSDVLVEILNVREAFGRMAVVSELLEQGRLASLKYQINPEAYSDSMYDAIFMFVVAIYILERIQFMSSFAVTFGICEMGLFEPIGSAVQAIARDEYTNHVPFGEYILTRLMGTPEGRASFERCKHLIFKSIMEVTNVELSWVDYMHEGEEDQFEIPKASKANLKKYVLWNALAVFKFFKMEKAAAKYYDFPTENPLPYMDEWLDVNDRQTSPQEQDNSSYKSNMVNYKIIPKLDYDLDGIMTFGIKRPSEARHVTRSDVGLGQLPGHIAAPAAVM